MVREREQQRKGRERGTNEEERKEGEREELRAVLNGKEETDQTGSEIGEKIILEGSKGLICWEC